MSWTLLREFMRGVRGEERKIRSPLRIRIREKRAKLFACFFSCFLSYRLAVDVEKAVQLVGNAAELYPLFGNDGRLLKEAIDFVTQLDVDRLRNRLGRLGGMFHSGWIRKYRVKGTRKSTGVKTKKKPPGGGSDYVPCTVRKTSRSGYVQSGGSLVPDGKRKSRGKSEKVSSM